MAGKIMRKKHHGMGRPVGSKTKWNRTKKGKPIKQSLTDLNTNFTVPSGGTTTYASTKKEVKTGWPSFITFLIMMLVVYAASKSYITLLETALLIIVIVMGLGFYLERKEKQQ